MRVNRWGSKVCFDKTPCIGFEIKNVELVSVIHKLIHASMHVHLVVVYNSDMGVSLTWKVTFLLDLFPFILLKRVGEKVT
jgi:hypothetical protein